MSYVQSFVRRVRLRHVLETIARFHYGEDLSHSECEGSASDGTYYNANGEGDFHVATWRDADLLALVFDHENTGHPYPDREEGLAAVFAKVPDALGDLVGRLTRWRTEPGMRAFWIHGEAHGRGEPVSELDVYLPDAPRRPSLAEIAGLSGVHQQLAERLVAASEGLERSLLTADDEETLLIAPGASRRAPAREDVLEAQRRLKQVGVIWSPTGRRASQATRSLALGEAEPQDPDAALVAAVEVDDVDAAKAALEAGARVDHSQIVGGKGLGRTPLATAVFRGALPMVVLLLERGANINKKSVFGTPLNCAAMRGHPSICSLLLERGASVDLLTNAVPLLRSAITGRSASVIRLLLDAGAEIPPSPSREALVEIAREQGAVDLVERLLAGRAAPHG